MGCSGVALGSGAFHVARALVRRKRETSMGPVLMWFRRDLRLADNPALTTAIAKGDPVIPVFILDAVGAGDADDVRPLGGASRWWLDKSLRALGGALAARGSRLIVRRGRSARVLTALARETGANSAAWARTHEPGAAERDEAARHALGDVGVEVETTAGSFLNPPGTVLNGSGEPYRVFTPYWRAARAAIQVETRAPAPSRIAAPSTWPASEPPETWALHPTRPDWSTRFDWAAGEAAAEARLAAFVGEGLARYHETRDRPGEAGSTRLSPHLAWGEIAPARIWSAAHAAVEAGTAGEAARDKLLSEVAWRDFNWQLLAAFPTLDREHFRPGFEGLAVRDAPDELEAWRRGRTGYPIVDAAMRQLWTTGWTPNRARLIAGSFLTKHLLIDWRAGERWFWDTLIDADPANNAMNWQWIAGSGPDAQPFHRIFNPVTQAEKFDPEGAYVRRWLPELAALPDAAIHRPWEASEQTLAAAGVRLGETYPRPIVEHAAARARALAAFVDGRGQARVAGRSEPRPGAGR